MIYTPEINRDLLHWPSLEREDGDIAVQKEQTSSCLEEAASLKAKKQVPKELEAQKSLGGVFIQGLNTQNSLLPHETLEISQKAESSANENKTSTAEKEKGRRDQPTPTYEEELERQQKRKKQIWENVNKKQGIKIATLNMRGRKDNKKKSKWPTLATLMRKQRMLILGLQETHLDEEEAETISKMCPKIEIISNGISKNKEGIAFAINKELANKMTWRHRNLIEGRASRLTIEVEEERGLDIILIYAPNGENEKKIFFEELHRTLEQEPKITNAIIMGDFNSVENELDRFPHRKDKEKVIEKWIETKKKFRLVDGWRQHNGSKKEYTYFQDNTHSMSRIDRIYLDNEIYPYGYNWSHINSAQLSDHDIATVEILKQKLPYIGEGIWRMQQSDIDDETVRKETKKLLKNVENEMKKIKNENNEGIQQLWMETKEKIKTIVEKTKKKRRQDIEKKKKKTEKKITKKLEEIERDNHENNKKSREELYALKKKLAKETEREIRRIQESAKARYRQSGEKYTKYWFKINKEKISSQIILSLQRRDGEQVDKTKDMKKIALEHHKDLQKKPEMTQERKEAISKLKETIKAKTSTQEKEYLKKKTSYNEIKESIKRAPNGSSPGIDGIPYEFYKQLMKENEKDNELPDIIGILHMVIEEIEKIGLRKINAEGKNDKKEFTDGIMHLLFKKKEKWKIENYRPITLLNTDYKTYTKTIAMRLAEVAKTMIHEDQAGFVPERSLYDHTKTTNMVIEYCEMMDKNGCIIALDQEKAYDKIDHEYLWQILEHYEFPKEFIERIKELYKNTGKSILVNGVMTEQYKVERGVHQGDPMSCLLYDFAIEPLADAIRQSKLKGIKINKEVKRLIVNLFADDTLVYLDKSDNFEELNRIIDTFCKASTARFNMEKTEYLPIGNKQFRKEAIRTRRIGKNKIEDNVKIIKEGEAMRTLGAWVGNEANTKMQWETILQKQEKVITAWSNTNMSLKGKEIILKALIQSKAMFLATVNGMPRDIEMKMKRLFKNFLWNEKTRGLMSWEQIIAPRERGGLAVPDIRARIDAIEIMWIKKWLAPEERKPRWTYILDEILKNNIAKSPIIDKESRINWLKQSWHESKARDSKLSKNVRNMLTVARKYNITLEPLKYSPETKKAEPLWHNRLMTIANYQWNKKSARCLRNNHDITTIKDLVEYETKGVCNEKACTEMIMRLRKMVPEIIDPTKGTPQKVKIKNLDLTPKRIKKNTENKLEKTFNPDITARGDVLKQVRIFNEKSGSKTKKTKIKPKPPAYRKLGKVKEGKTKALIAISRKKEGRKDQETKIKIRMTGATKKTRSFELAKENQSQERARAMALLWILKKEKKNQLTIVTTDIKLIEWIGNGINERENINWNGTEEEDMWKEVLNLLRKRNAITKIRYPEKKEKKKVKEMKSKLKKENPEVIDRKPITDGIYLQDGAKLEKMTQKLAYELVIKKLSTTPGGKESIDRINKIKKNLENKWDTKINSEKTWKDLEYIKNAKIQEFIWKIIHNRIKCGKYFRFIPNWQEKQYCCCGEIESIEHILLRCKKSKQRKVWKEVKKTWKKTTKRKWKRLSVLDIMGIGSVNLKGEKDNTNAKEILITLVTTAAWSIWKNRNNRVFNDKPETKEKQVEKWKEDLKKEIEIEYELIQQTDIRKREKKLKRFLDKWGRNGSVVTLNKGKRDKKVLVISI